MKPTQTAYGTEELVEKVRKGKIALPDFQRPYRWPPSEVAELLRSMAREWPIGSFLLLRLGSKLPFAMRQLVGAPRLNKPDLMVLDGQQRLTSVFQVFTDSAEEIYYVEIGNVVDTGRLDDDFVRYEKKASFYKKYPRPIEQVNAGVIPVSAIWADQGFSDWVTLIPEGDRQPFWDARNGELRGLTDYQVPALELPANVELPVLARIFEDVNRRGRPLKAYDLMVAKLFPGGFRLRDRAREAIKKHSIAHPFFDYPKREEAHEIFAMEVLKLIALRTYLEQRAGKKTKGQPPIRGIRESDVLDLDAATVKKRWAAAVRDYVRALKLVRDRCGAIAAGLLPQRTILLPLANVLSGTSRAKWPDDAERWYWATCFRQTYAQGANTQATRDAASLEAWRADRHAVPEVVREFTPGALDDVLTERRPRNEIALRALLCLLVQHGARDWISGKPLRDSDGALEVHHCFSKGFWKARKAKGPSGEEALVNFVALFGSTNKAIREESPGYVAKRTDVSRAAIESHRIDYEAFRKQQWTTFAEKRIASLRTLIVDAVGSE